MKNIFVGNLSYNVSENALRSLFEEYGTVDRVSIVTDRDTGQQKGFAFVEMSVDAEGDRAIESLSGRDMNGRAMTVNEARPKADRGSGGGGGYDGNRAAADAWHRMKIVRLKRIEARTNLPKEDSIEALGKVVEKFKAGMFSIELDAGMTVLATMAGRLRRNRIKIMNGDRVSLELSPYDLTRGRITYRHK